MKGLIHIHPYKEGTPGCNPAGEGTLRRGLSCGDKYCRAWRVTTQGLMEVAKFLAVKGPRGTYSHFWMSLRTTNRTDTSSGACQRPPL